MTSTFSNRGQATVELALGSLVFVSILLFGIHYAEFGILKLRVQQAAHSALFDATHSRMHNYVGAAPTFHRADQVEVGPAANNENAAQRAKRIHKDFTAVGGGGNGTITQAFTRGSELDVNCAPIAVAPFNLDLDRYDSLRVSLGHPGFAGDRVDGMECSAEGMIATLNISESFAQKTDGSFFNRAASTAKQRNGIKVCAFGRQRNGECEGSVSMAYDDWGLAGSSAGAGEELGTCGQGCGMFGMEGNRAYRTSVERVYKDYNAKAHNAAVAKLFVADFISNLFATDPDIPSLMNPPADEREFRFLFMGEGDDFKFEATETNFNGFVQRKWAITPYAGHYVTAHQDRGECFLGSRCDKPVFEKNTW